MCFNQYGVFKGRDLLPVQDEQLSITKSVSRNVQSCYKVREYEEV